MNLIYFALKKKSHCDYYLGGSWCRYSQMSSWEDEGSPLLDFLWDLGSVHIFSGEHYLTRKFSHVLIIPTKGLLVSRELGQEKK